VQENVKDTKGVNISHLSEKDRQFNGQKIKKYKNTQCNSIFFFISVINIFIGIRLEKAATSSTAYYIFIVYEVFQVAIIIVLEVLRINF
jgi:hypothetical protein